MKGAAGRKSGLVLSGGSADSAYAVGVVKALSSGDSPCTGGRPLDPEILTGTSAGAYNAALLTAEAEKAEFAQAVSRLEEAWLEQLADSLTSCGNGVFRLRGYPPEYLQPYCLLTQPFQEASQLLSDTASLALDTALRAVKFGAMSGPVANRLLELVSVEPFIEATPYGESIRKTIDFSVVPQARRQVRVVATNWTTGTLQVFGNRELTPDFGRQEIMASGAVPGVFPPVEIGGQIFVDGLLLMNTPLSLAIKAGADDLYVIYFDPDVQDIPIPTLSSTLDSFYRVLVITFATAINQDVEVAGIINRTILNLRRVLARSLENEVQSVLRNILQVKKKKTFRLLNIHLFHPRDDLGGLLGLLDFDRTRIESLIARGYQDALRHDCAASNCVLARDGRQ